MDKLKDMLFKINAKFPLLTALFWLALAADAGVAYYMIDVFTFEPNFLQLYGLEDASTVRARVEEQMRRYKPKPPPPPAPPPAMAYEVRLLRQHNPFLPPGFIEQSNLRDDTVKVTDVAGIDLIGTVYSYTPQRRSALIEMNGVSLVVVEGRNIRGTQKKVIEIGRSRIMVQEEGLLPSPVELPGEHGLDNLTSALAQNVYKTQSNWEYSTRSGKKADVKEEDEEGGEEAKPKAKKGGKSAADAAAAEEAAAEEEEEEEEPAPEESGGGGGGGPGPGGGIDIGGGE